MRNLSYTEYQANIEEDLKTCLDKMQCQPILFIGSGFSRRYIGAPDWHGLLEAVAKRCPGISMPYTYFRQLTPEAPDIATVLAEKFHDWAWGKGGADYPPELFEGAVDKSIYLKHQIAKYVHEITPRNFGAPEGSYYEELQQLRGIQPHALITTNYDTLLESVFSDYEKIVGQEVLSGASVSIGEILKIHGCISDPASIVTVRADYDNFTRRSKYLSAKLLTYFAEHPLVFIGYSATDQNVRDVLADLDLILSPSGRTIDNVYLVRWHPDPSGAGIELVYDELISVGIDRHVRVKCIVASDFSWIYSALSHRSPMRGINIKALRAFSARLSSLVRTDLTSPTRSVNFENIVRYTDSESLPLLLGIGQIDDPSKVNLQYPYTTTDVASKLGHKTWHLAVQLICKIKAEKGVDVRSGDNKYHIKVRSGKSFVNKYSEQLVELLRQVHSGKEYVLDLDS